MLEEGSKLLVILLNLWSLRWRKYVSLKCQWTSTKLQGIISQEMVFFIVLHSLLIKLNIHTVSHVIAQVISCWLLTVETTTESWLTSCKICAGWSGTGTVCSPSFFGFLILIIIPPLLHIHLSLLHNLCFSPDHAAHYNILSL